MNDLAALPPAVRAYLRGFVARGRWLAALRGLGVAGAMFLAWMLLCCVVDRYAHFHPLVRVGLLAAGGGAAALVFLNALRGLVRRGADWAEVAERIERQNPRFEQRLVTVTSRLLGRAEYRGSDEILDQLVFEVNRQAEREQASMLLPLRGIGRPWLALLAVVVVGAGVMRLPGLGLPQLSKRFLTPMAGLAPVTTTQLAVAPGNRDLPQSTALQIDVDVTKLRDGQVWLVSTEDGSHWTRTAMAPASAAASPSADAGDGRYTHTFNTVDRDLRYYVAAGDATSLEYAARVLRAPAVTEFRIRYVYPAYTGRQPLTVSNADGLIEAPVGTEAFVSVVATEPLLSAMLTVGGVKVVMDRAGPDNVRQGRVVVRKEAEGRYGLDVLSTREQAGTGPPTMQVKALPDHPPVVRVSSQPGDNLRLNPRDILPLTYEALDDYAVASIALRAQVGNNPAIDIPIDDASGTGTVAGPGQVARVDPAARRREGLFNFDLAGQPLNLGDVMTLVLVARDTAGQQAFSDPLHVLVSPRSIDLDTHERLADLSAAARLGEQLAGSLDAAVRSLEYAERLAKEKDATTAAGYAAARASRALSDAAESAALLRRSALRAVVNGAPPELSTALASWVDSAQLAESAAHAAFRGAGSVVNDGPAEKEPGKAVRELRQSLKREQEAAKALASDLKVIAAGERSVAVLLDRENLSAIEKRPAPADAKSADRFRQTLKRGREDVAAAAASLELNPNDGDFEAKLKGKIEAAATLAKARRPIDFTAAAGEWAQRLKADASKPTPLAERLAAAAQAEAVRADADLTRARDADLAARAADAIANRQLTAAASGGASESPALDAFVVAWTEMQREHELNRRPPADARPPEESQRVRDAAAAARLRMAGWTGDTTLAVAVAPRAAPPSTTTPASEPASGPAGPPADGSARSAIAGRSPAPERLALEASAATADRNYAKTAQLDRQLAGQLAATTANPATTDASTSPTTGADAPPVPVSRSAAAESLRAAGQETARAERLDAIGGGQAQLADASRVAAAASAARSSSDAAATAQEAAALAQRQRDVADQIGAAARPLDAVNRSTESTGDPNWRERATGVILEAQSQLAAMPQQLADYQEQAAARRASDARLEAAKRDAAGVPAERKSAADRAAAAAEQDAKEAANRLEVAARPVSPVAGEVLAAALEPYAPEMSPARDVIGLQLVPALRALREAGKTSDPMPAARAAGEARQAIEAAQRELARAQDTVTQRDPMASAKWFARAAADALSRKPPDYVAAERLQRDTSSALSRAWDRSIHQAASHRLSALPSLRSLFQPGSSSQDNLPLADGSRPPAAAPLPGPAGATARDFRRLRARDGQDVNAAFRETDPAGYEAALKVYFEALGKPREGSR